MVPLGSTTPHTWLDARPGSLRQVVTLNKNFLRELEEVLAGLQDPSDDAAARFAPVLAEFAPLLVMYTSYQKAQQGTSRHAGSPLHER